MGDCDVLVPRARLHDAVGVLRAAGWTQPRELTDEVLDIAHAAVCTGPAGAQIDLHWRIYCEGIPEAQQQAMWQASVPLDLGGVSTRALSVPDQLLHVVVHGFSVHLHSAPVGWLADGAALLQSAGDAFPWDRLIQRAEACRFTATLRCGLDYLSRHYDVRVPGAVLERLRALRRSRWERLELWFKLRAGPQAPWGRGPLRWFRYLRTCDRLQRRPGVIGFLRHWAVEAQKPGAWSLAADLGLWPLRQLLWLSVASSRRLPDRSRRMLQHPPARSGHRDASTEARATGIMEDES
jgi:hypothetical protein